MIGAVRGNSNNELRQTCWFYLDQTSATNLYVANCYGGLKRWDLRETRCNFSDHVEVHVKLHGGYYIAWRQRRVSGVTVGSPDQYLQPGTQTPDDFFGCVARLTGYRSRSEPEYLKSQGAIGV